MAVLRAMTPVWMQRDANCCPTGGAALAGLAIEGVRVNARSECAALERAAPGNQPTKVFRTGCRKPARNARAGHWKRALLAKYVFS